jgi:hypothetical protein
MPDEANMMQVIDPFEPPRDAASLGWPATLPLEVAMRTASNRTICEAYGITREEWDALRYDERFLKEVHDAREMLKQEGMSFRVKARLQSEELLKTSWRMIHHASTPPAVAADLIKFTIKAAGLSEEKKNEAANVGTALQININL